MDVGVQRVVVVDPRTVYHWEGQVGVCRMDHFCEVWDLLVHEDWLAEGLVHRGCLQSVYGRV